MGPELPPGFVLQEAPPTGGADLPPGFVLIDAPPRSTPTEPQGSGLPYIGSKDFRLSTIAGHLYDAAKNAVSVPGEVYRGETAPTSDRAIGAMTDLATIASPLSAGKMVTQAERSALFADPRSASARVAPSPPEVAVDAAAAAASAVGPSKGEIVAAAERVGVEVPRAALLPSWAQKVGAGISDLPVVGAPLQRSAERAITRGEESVAELASRMGTPSREGAGQSIKEGVQAFKAEAIPQIEREAFAPINEAIAPSQRFSPVNTIETIAQMQRRLGESGGQLSGESARIQRALEQNKGSLNFQAIQDLRSALGKEMRDPINRQGYDDFVSSRLYGTLSEDLREAARAAGGDALASSWDDANRATREAYQQFGQVKRYGAEAASPNATFEQVFSLAMDKRGDVGKLVQLRKTMPAEEWSNVAATAVDRLGRNNADQFSMQFFVSNYDRMAPSARKVLFGESSSAIDDLATSFKALQGIERFKSKSQSANPMAMLAGGGATAGLLTSPVSTLSGALAAYGTASWMAKPASAKALARYAKNYEIFVRRPSEGLAKSAITSANRFGVILAEDLGIPAAANDLARPLVDAVRASAQGRAAGASPRATDQDEQEDGQE